MTESTTELRAGAIRAQGAPSPQTATSPWLSTLSHEQRLELRRLHELRPAWNLVILLYPVAWAIASWTVMAYPVWWVRLPGYVAIGIAIHAMSVLVHEASHMSLFRHRRWDRWVGFLLGAPVMVSASAYRTLHAFHHRHTRQETDPDEFLYVAKNKVLVTILFYLWPIIGTPVYLVHVPVTALTRGTAREKREVLEEYALLFAGWAVVLSALAYTGRWDIFVHCWVLPMVIGMAFGNIRGWSEHAMTRQGSPLTHTRTVTSNRVVSFVMCNLNYHLEHHLLPAIPWYNLPKVHALLKGKLEQAGANIYTSYLVFLRDAFTTGVHGIALIPMM